VFTAKNAQIIHSRWWGVSEPLRKVFGERWEGRNWSLLPQDAKWQNKQNIALVRLGVPVLPAQRPDGHEYPPLNDRAPWLDMKSVNALAEAGVDFSRHSHLGIGECPIEQSDARRAYERERVAVDRMVEGGADELRTPPERHSRVRWGMDMAQLCIRDRHHAMVMARVFGLMHLRGWD
jgi:hypothetical protein